MFPGNLYQYVGILCNMLSNVHCFYGIPLTREHLVNRPGYVERIDMSRKHDSSSLCFPFVFTYKPIRITFIFFYAHRVYILMSGHASDIVIIVKRFSHKSVNTMFLS